MEEEDITEVMPRMVMYFVRQRERRDEAQQAIESMVQKVGRFNENEVPKFLEAYNVEMTAREVEEAYGYEKLEGQGRRKFDRWVASVQAPRSAIKEFREFKNRSAQLSERDRRSVGAEKVLLFLREGWPLYSNSKTMMERTASPRIGLK